MTQPNPISGSKVWIVGVKDGKSIFSFSILPLYGIAVSGNMVFIETSSFTKFVDDCLSEDEYMG
jgi:hypothetical protein